MADVKQIEIETPKQVDAMESAAPTKPVAVAAIKDDAKSKGMMVGGVLVFGGLAVGIGAGVGVDDSARVAWWRRHVRRIHLGVLACRAALQRRRDGWLLLAVLLALARFGVLARLRGGQL